MKRQPSKNGDAILTFADSFARSPEVTVAPSPAQFRTWLIFALDGETLAIDAAVVEEIVRVPLITRVPDAPSFVKGIFNHRGRILGAIDLRLRLWFAPANLTENSRVLIVTLAGRAFGLLVDEVRTITRLSDDTVEPLPKDVHEESPAGFILGIVRLADSIVMLLDAETALLSSPATE